MGTIRLETVWDDGPIYQLLNQAFGRRAEGELVSRLRTRGDIVPQLCLVADQDNVVVGYICYSYATLESTPPRKVPALAPMAVTPAFQRRGVGTALMNESLARAEARGEALVVVVGHPEYYPRFGFVPGSSLGIECPWPEIPDEAFMVKPLDAYEERMRGRVRYPEAFDLAP